MRAKDEEKQEALFRATVKVVNRIGFASSSVSKIAKEAGVSPATLYVYYENKDDLLISTYLDIKRELSDFVFKDMKDTLPLRDVFRQVWFNLCQFTMKHAEFFQFSEQFANSPIYNRVNQKEIEQMFLPIARLIEKGIKLKIIKDVEVDVVSAFVFYPVIILANPRLCRNFSLTYEQMERSFQMAWDAIKL